MVQPRYCSGPKSMRYSLSEMELAGEGLLASEESPASKIRCAGSLSTSSPSSALRLVEEDDMYPISGPKGSSSASVCLLALVGVGGSSASASFTPVHPTRRCESGGVKGRGGEKEASGDEALHSPFEGLFRAFFVGVGGVSSALDDACDSEISGGGVSGLTLLPST